MSDRRIVILYPTEETQKNLEDLYKNYHMNYYINSGHQFKGISYSEPFEYHVTIICSENDVPEFIPGEYKIDPIELIPEKIEYIGRENDITCIKIRRNHKLDQIRFNYEYGFYFDMGYPRIIPTFSEYRPHISLSYEPLESNIDIPIPRFPLIFDTIKIKEFQKDFGKSVKSFKEWNYINDKSIL